MNRGIKKVLALVMALVMVLAVCPQTQLFTVTAADEDNTPYNLSVDRPVLASSVSGNDSEDKAVDGKDNTRWQAAKEDKNEWLYVDLGKVATIDYIYMHWEAAYAKYYDIQVSDDEINWTTVYSKGKNAGAYVDMAVSYKYTGVRTDGDYRFNVNWTSVENANYQVYVDDEIAIAGGDDYKFTTHGNDNGDIRFKPGTHTVKVVAINKDTKEEIGSGTCIVDAQEGASGNNGIEVDTQAALKQTIDSSQLSKNTGRYVKIITTERATDYGSSLWEFQVWGTGGANKRPENYGTNIALNQPVQCSGIRDEWWMKDEEGNVTEGAYNEVKPENAVDGNTSTAYTSYQGEGDQWLYVDLKKTYTIGRVVTRFNDDAGKIYDIQVSSDAKNWKTIHRQMRGYTSIVDNITCYHTNVRYVKVLVYSKVEHGSGFGLRELEVYEYKDGDSKTNETVTALPTRQIINNASGKGSYVTGEIKKELNKLPTFVNEENVKVPIDSNSWWSSAMVKTYGNMDIIHPLKAVYSKKGLGVILASQGFTNASERQEEDLGMSYYTEKLMDFYVRPDNFLIGSGYDRVEGYGDYSVDLGLCDEEGLKMKSTFVKGSPYIFTEYKENQTVFINSSSIKEVFDGNGNTILSKAGETVVTDHIGFKSVDEENEKAGNDGSYFAVTVPEGTRFTATTVGASTVLKVEFPSKNDAYMSFGAMTKKADLNTYYQHGYAYVTDTQVDYTYDKLTSKINTTYTVSTKVKRGGFSDVTMQAFYPHQWKHSTDTDKPDAVYGSIRGNMKAKFANVLTTTQQFAGLLPTFAKPNSDMFDSSEAKDYLNTVLNQLGTEPNADAYWQGKAVHPLAISALMADQIGETEIRDGLLKNLKKIMVDWFTYNGDGDRCYLIYNKDWGTLYYPESAYGANAAICDHHFTYGYFMFGAAVLATYDKTFYNDYKDMIELLVRDYANPEEPENDGNMFCKFRAFDQYSGHSWAGGYADNDDGNNQESASESLFSWVGMYLWGEASQNQKYIDAGAYGFTTEMEAVEQYWFDYDGDNWLPEYPFQGTGQVYGATYGYTTFFGGQPLFVYGIQWLPISEYLTNYGMNQEKCKNMYQGLWDDTEDAKRKVLINANKNADKWRKSGEKTEEEIQAYLAQEQKTHDEYATPDTGWQHITWPMLSQTNPKAAYDLFEANVDKMQSEDRINTLWFVSAMDQLGYRTNDYVIVGQTLTGSVYKKSDGKGGFTYTGEVWNPTTATKTVKIVNPKTGDAIGKAKVSGKALVQFNIDPAGGMNYVQTATPTIKSTGLEDGEVKSNVTGVAKFENTQIVELSCATEGAKIYYTTDGTTPTKDSEEYTGKFMVSSDSTVKAVAIKDGNIDSAYASATFKIDGDAIESSDNLALGKKVTASSKEETMANVVDGDSKTSWQGAETNDEWIQVDLGTVKAINTVNINWETAFASKYEIQVSTDGETWTTVKEEVGTKGEVTSTFEAVKARYVRMQGIKRATQYGYCIFELEVYGANQAKAPTITPTSGTYDKAQTVMLSTAVKGAEIKYTTDGTDPTEKSQTYSEPFVVDSSTQVKAVTYRKGMLLSDVTVSTILISGTLGLNFSSANIAIGNTVQLAPLTAEKVTWSSSAANIASVDANGLVTGKAKGEVTITATVSGGKTATCKVVVSEAKHITGVEIKPNALTMKNKSSDTVEAVITPADTTDDTTATWTSSDNNIVTVNDNGTLTAKSEGKATISVTVAGKRGTCQVTVGPQATIQEMISDGKYNLALGKLASVSSIWKGEGSETTGVLTDGNLNSNFVRTDKNTGSEYVLIDLGANYNTEGIDVVGIQFVNPLTYCGNYKVALSDTGIDFVDVDQFKGMTYESSEDGLFKLPLKDYSNKLKTTRYIKITLEGDAPYGFQIREVAVLSTEMKAKEVETEHCDDPANFVVTAETPLQIDYEIIADKGQNGYQYFIFLDGVKATDLMNAGKGSIKTTAGKHTIKAVAYYDGKLSAGISRSVVVDDGSLRDYVNTDRNLAKGAKVEVKDIYTKEGSDDPQKLTDGDINGEQVETVWGVDDATITLTMENAVLAKDVEEVLLAFVNNATYAKKITIQFSKDGNKYETVATETGVTYAAPVEVKVDTSKYTQGDVQYVRIQFADKVAGYGYQLREIAVMGTADKFMPKEPYGLSLTSPEDGAIQVSFQGDNSNGETYRIYIDDEIKDMNLANAGTKLYTALDGGSHTVKVTSVLNGIESKGITGKISIKEGEKPTEIDSDDGIDDRPIVTQEITTNKGGSSVETTTNKGGSSVETTTNKGGSSEETTTNKGGAITPPKTTVVSVKAPGKAKIKKIKAKKKSAKKVKLTLKKITGAKGYQVAIYKTKKNAKKNKKALLKKIVKKTKVTIKSKKLKNKKKLFARARAYKLNGKTKVYGTWSGIKRIKIKK